jgi:hypothetical protein
MTEETQSKPKRKLLLEILDEMVKTYENLPQIAMMQPITHYDHQSLLLLIQALFADEG